MSATDAPVRTGPPPAGAVFQRCALQVNPHHYGKTFRGRATDGDSHSYAEAIVAKATEVGVSVLAVTDHNSVADVSAFRDAAAGGGVTVFPGFELSSSEGIHVLCIYPQDTKEDRLERFLGEFGITHTAPSSDVSKGTFVEILEKVRRQAGVTIAAHVTAKHGLLKTLSGQPCITAWRSADLLAIQIPGPVQGLPQDLRRIVENKNGDYRRPSAAGDGLAAAAVNAKDVTKPEDLADPAATCWIKMSEVGIEGLRQAFLDPESRIRLNPRREPEEHAELLSLAWEGGFLDGTVMPLNPNLNVLIGGRGAGKSTVIESLRYALGLDAVGEDAHKAHQGIGDQVLRSGTKVSLRVRCHRLARREYVIERTVPNPPVVCDEDGRVSNLSPEEILPRVEVYGQHEISELARSGRKLTRLLDRFVERDRSPAKRKTDLQCNLKKTSQSLLEVGAELARIEERLATLPGLEETLERFRDAGLEERLRERRLLVREERVLDSIPERLEPLYASLKNLRQGLPIDRVFLSPKALEDLPGRVPIMDGNAVLERLSRALEQVTARSRRPLRRPKRTSPPSAIVGTTASARCRPPTRRFCVRSGSPPWTARSSSVSDARSRAFARFRSAEPCSGVSKTNIGNDGARCSSSGRIARQRTSASSTAPRKK